MIRHVTLWGLALACLVVASQQADAQVVNFSFEELALDGSNIDTSGVQVTGANASGDAVSSNGVDWNLNSGNVSATGTSGIGDRNNRVGGPPAPYVHIVSGGESEAFAAGSFTGIDAYHDPLGTMSETALHDALESILFGGSFEIGIDGLIPGHDYRVQIVSWDAGVEAEGDGVEANTKEWRFSTIEATSAGASGSMPYNQFVVDGTSLTSPDSLWGNSSDEITAALITAEFTAASSDIAFTMAVDQSVLNSTGGVSNDNAIFNALTVHNLTVPEPAAALLATMGLLALGLFRRR